MAKRVILVRGGQNRKKDRIENYTEINIRDFKHLFKESDKKKDSVIFKINKQPIIIVWKQIGCMIRPFFICPKCSRQTSFLYLKNQIWLCRECHKLTYPNNRITSSKKQIFKYKNRYRKLKEKYNIGDAWEKPACVHLNTWENVIKLKNEYEQKIKELEENQRQAN
jgi:ribosomal protein L37AE/L43A